VHDFIRDFADIDRLLGSVLSDDFAVGPSTGVSLVIADRLLVLEQPELRREFEKRTMGALAGGCFEAGFVQILPLPLKTDRLTGPSTCAASRRT
jgi:hypothetical protein